MSQFRKPAPRVPPVPPQEAVLDILRRYARLGAGTPSNDDIAARVGSSRTVVRAAIAALAHAGRIKITQGGRYRSIEIVEAP